MEVVELKNDINVFGIQVKTFPEGIGEAFDLLVSKYGRAGEPRSYYGVSRMDHDKMVYVAAVEEKTNGEANGTEYEQVRIGSGKYLSVKVKDWREKTGGIKEVFHNMLQDNRVDKKQPCVEWYKNEDELICLVKMIQD